MNITLKGYKGKIGGIGLIATGIGIIATGIKSGNVWEVMPQGLASISAGLGIFGIRVAMD